MSKLIVSFKSAILAFCCCVLLFTTSCSEDDDLTSGFLVITGNAENVSYNSVELKLKVNKNRLDKNSIFNYDVGFVFSDTNSQPTFENDECVYDTPYFTPSNGEISIKIKPLHTGTKYYYCAFIKINDDIYYAKDVKTFETIADPLNDGNLIVTQEATAVDYNTASVTASINREKLEHNSIGSWTYGIVYSSTNKTPTLEDTSMEAYSSYYNSTTFSLRSLSVGTTYYYRGYVKYGDTVIYSSDVKSFTTLADDLNDGNLVVTKEATNVDYNSASIMVTIDSNKLNHNNISGWTYGIVYSSAAKTPTFDDTSLSASSSYYSSTTFNLKSLTLGTTYYYRGYVKYGDTVIYSSDVKSFTTLDDPLDDGKLFTSQSAYNITKNSASINITIDRDKLTHNGITSYILGMVYSGTNDVPTINDESQAYNSYYNHTFSVYNLESGARYYYRGFVQIEDKIIYSDEVFSFLTLGPIDLGLSVKWSSNNVGANKPEDLGYIIAWGETGMKSQYTESTYRWYNKTYDELFNSDVLDSKSNLTAAYDAATYNLGKEWRMPTKAEQLELVQKCQWVWTTRNGNNGYEVTGPNGNSIFLPAGGATYGYYYSGTKSTVGLYWGATRSVSGAAFIHFTETSMDTLIKETCFWGGSIRAVMDY